MHTVTVFNSNASHQMVMIDLQKIDQDKQHESWFTCSCTGYSQEGNEFIAVATSDGRIFQITPQPDGVNFTKRVAFQIAT